MAITVHHPGTHSQRARNALIAALVATAAIFVGYGVVQGVTDSEPRTVSQSDSAIAIETPSSVRQAEAGSLSASVVATPTPSSVRQAEAASLSAVVATPAPSSVRQAEAASSSAPVVATPAPSSVRQAESARWEEVGS